MKVDVAVLATPDSPYGLCGRKAVLSEPVWPSGKALGW